MTNNKKNKITAVSFHRVSDENSPAYPPIPVKVFEKLIQYLKKEYTIVSLYDIEKENTSDKERLIITFDDAFSDFRDNVLPILKKHNIPSVLNAITSCLDTGETFWTQKLNKIVEWYYFNKTSIQHPIIGSSEILLNEKNVEKISFSIYNKLLTIEAEERNKIIQELAEKHKIDIKQSMLNWEDLEYCKANNVIIGNHTINHVNLTTLSKQDLKKEIEESTKEFRTKIGSELDIMAFPNGQFNKQVIEECKNNNYKYLLTTESNSFSISSIKGSSLLIIPRIDLHSRSLWKNILRLKIYSRSNRQTKIGVAKEQSHYACLTCNSTNLRKLSGYEKDSLVQCQDCEFIFSQKIPTQKELVEYYEGTYTRDDYLSPITIKRYNEVLDTLEPYRKNNRILDIGSGVGYFLEVAQDRGWEIYGTEYTDDAYQICKRKGAIMHLGSLDPKNYSQDFFDVVTSFEVIEHINNPLDELPAYNEILRKGGAFYFTTPNFNSIERYILKGKYSAIKYPEHLSYFTKRTINDLFVNNGFKKIRLGSTGFSFSRIRHSLKRKGAFKVSKTYDDEIIRQNFEKSALLRFSKYVINNLLNTFNVGNSLKGLYEKE